MGGINTDIMKYLYRLPFAEKKRIIEAVIAPSNGGKVFLKYADDNEDEFVLDMKFDIDIDRTESLISGLNRKDLFDKVQSVYQNKTSYFCCYLFCRLSCVRFFQQD